MLGVTLNVLAMWKCLSLQTQRRQLTPIKHHLVTYNLISHRSSLLAFWSVCIHLSALVTGQSGFPGEWSVRLPWWMVSLCPSSWSVYLASLVSPSYWSVWLSWWLVSLYSCPGYWSVWLPWWLWLVYILVSQSGYPVQSMSSLVSCQSAWQW